jgi:hypothetical protein
MLAPTGAKRSLVDPGIVDHQRDRLLGREVGAEPVKAMQRPKAGVDRRRRRRRPLGQEHRNSQAGRSDEQTFTAADRAVTKVRLKQLTDRTERPLVLKLRSPAAQNRKTALLGGSRSSAQKARFAQPRRSLNHDQAARAGPGAVQPNGQAIQLTPANDSASTSPPNASPSYCCTDRKDPPNATNVVRCGRGP